MLCESPIDCLSHCQLYGSDSAYVAIGGTPSALQRDLLNGLLLKAAHRDAKVYVAFDNDKAGNDYSDALQLLSPKPLERLTPQSKDWNEDLINNTRYSTWRVKLVDGRSFTMREAEPTCFQEAWRYAKSLTGAISIESVGLPV